MLAWLMNNLMYNSYLLHYSNEWKCMSFLFKSVMKGSVKNISIIYEYFLVLHYCNEKMWNFFI